MNKPGKNIVSFSVGKIMPVGKWAVFVYATDGCAWAGPQFDTKKEAIADYAKVRSRWKEQHITLAHHIAKAILTQSQGE